MDIVVRKCKLAFGAYLPYIASLEKSKRLDIWCGWFRALLCIGKALSLTPALGKGEIECFLLKQELITQVNLALTT